MLNSKSFAVKLSTTMMFLSVCLVAIVSATLIGSFNSPVYTYTAEAMGAVEMSEDNATWSTNPDDGVGGAAAMYVRWVTADGYSGPATITWQLQYNSGAWTDVSGASIQSIVTLTGSAGQIIYVTGDGSGPTNNHNWANEFTASGQYRVNVRIDST